MIKNNNSRILKSLSNNSIKSHKARSKMTVIAIVLTCILITSMLTITASVVKSMEYTTALQVGSSSHISFKQVTESQKDSIIKHDSLKDYGVSTILGLLEDDKLLRRITEVRTMDESFMETSFMLPIEGRYPLKYNEIVVDDLWLELVGLDQELDQEVSLTLNMGNKLYTESFVVVGIAQSNRQINTSFMVVSDEFKSRYVTDEIGENFLGAVDVSANFNSKYNLGDKAYKVLIESDLDPTEVKVGFNWAYLNNLSSLQSGDLFTYIFILLLMMFSGYLIIYNIYLIAITKDIKYYGLLKTIGTTEKQIKKIVYKQGMRLYLISLPIGLSIGYLFGILLVPLIISNLNFSVSLSSNHILIFIFAALMTLLTVLVSCRKPAKHAGKVSPIEAIRHTELTYNGKTKKRKTGHKIKNMARSNLFRSKKKAVLVILSLTLSLTIFSLVIMQVENFDEDDFVSMMIGSDYLIASTDYFTYNFDQSLPEILLDDLQGDVHTLYRDEKKIILTKEHQEKLLSDIKIDETSLSDKELLAGYMMVELYGTDEFILDLLSNYIVEGEIGGKLHDDEIILESHYFNSVGVTQHGISIGDWIDVEGKSYKVIAMVDGLPLYLYDQSFRENSIHAYVSKQAGDLMSVMVNGDVDQKKIESLYPLISVKSRAYYKDDIKGYLSMIKIVGFSLSLLLALIGTLNFINMMNTSIVIRKREFAILQSIGMTSKQFKAMLIYEGGYVVLITSLVSILLSLSISLIQYGHLSFNILPWMFIMIIAFGAIVLYIPVFTYHTMMKESIVNRLNTAE